MPGKPLSPARLGRLLLHGMLILNFGLAIGYAAAWLIAWRQDLFWRADFSAFYTGWAIVRDGLGASLYDFALQTAYQADILAGRSFKDGLLPFINPPGLALVFTPLSFLPLSTAFALWSLAMAGLLARLLVLLRRLSQAWDPQERWALFAVALAFPPLFTTLLLGAFSLLMLVCFFELYLSLKRDRQAAAAVWLFIGAIKPQLILLPGLIAIGARRWKTLAWTGLAGLAMILISSAALGGRIWLDWARQLSAVGSFFGRYGIDPAGMYNFRGLLTTLLGSGQASRINALGALGLGASFLAAFLIWRRPVGESMRGETVRSDAPAFELRVALTLILALFFNLHLYPQDGLLYLAPAVLFYEYLRRSRRPRRLFAVCALLCPFFCLFTEFNLGMRLGVRGPVLAALILLGWIAGEYIRGEYIRAETIRTD